jgi:hypothetical protein
MISMLVCWLLVGNCYGITLSCPSKSKPSWTFRRTESISHQIKTLLLWSGPFLHKLTSLSPI